MIIFFYLLVTYNDQDHYQYLILTHRFHVNDNNSFYMYACVLS